MLSEIAISAGLRRCPAVSRNIVARKITTTPGSAPGAGSLNGVAVSGGVGLRANHPAPLGRARDRQGTWLGPREADARIGRSGDRYGALLGAAEAGATGDGWAGRLAALAAGGGDIPRMRRVGAEG